MCTRRAPGIQINVPAIHPSALPPNITPSSSSGFLTPAILGAHVWVGKPPTLVSRAILKEKKGSANRNEPSRGRGRSLLDGQDMDKTQHHRRIMEQWLAVGGSGWLVVGGWWLMTVGGWRLVGVCGWRLVAVGGP